MANKEEVNVDYVPFGVEWKKTVMLMKKEIIVDLYAKACMERQRETEQKLYYQKKFQDLNSPI
jgi:hypothetical protein